MFLAGDLGFQSWRDFIPLDFFTVNGPTHSTYAEPVSMSLAPEGSSLLVVHETTPFYSN